jgi:hypothetical protein
MNIMLITFITIDNIFNLTSTKKVHQLLTIVNQHSNSCYDATTYITLP